MKARTRREKDGDTFAIRQRSEIDPLPFGIPVNVLPAAVVAVVLFVPAFRQRARNVHGHVRASVEIPQEEMRRRVDAVDRDVHAARNGQREQAHRETGPFAFLQRERGIVVFGAIAAQRFGRFADEHGFIQRIEAIDTVGLIGKRIGRAFGEKIDGPQKCRAIGAAAGLPFFIGQRDPGFGNIERIVRECCDLLKCAGRAGGIGRGELKHIGALQFGRKRAGRRHGAWFFRILTAGKQEAQTG